MSPVAASLLVSLLLNAGLLAVLSTVRTAAGASERSDVTPGVTSPQQIVTTPTAYSAPSKLAMRRSYSTSELRQLVDVMRGAGYSPSVVRESIKKIVGRRAERETIAWMYPSAEPFWRQGVRAHQGVDRRTAVAKITADQVRQVHEVLGDLSVDTDSPLRQLEWERRMGKAIPKAKFDEILRLADKAYLQAMTNAEAGTAASEQAHSAMRSEIARILSPTELAEYELRYSRITGKLSA